MINSDGAVGEPARILYVDSDLQSRDSFAKALEQTDYAVDLASHGVEALSFAQRHDYAVLATDLRIPDMGGLELIDHFRTYHPASIALVVTESTDVPSPRERASVASLVFKPWQPRDLLSSVETAINLWRTNQQSEPDWMTCGQRTILLVEDDESDARLAVLKLEEVLPEYSVVHVPSLAVAMEKLATQPFDAALVDLSLPDAFGLDVVNRLVGREPELPIVVLTGNDDIGLALVAMQVGAEGYLSKDRSDNSDFRRTLMHAVEHKRGKVRLMRRKEELEHANLALGSDLEERQREITRLGDELAVARRLGSIGQIAAGIAHELRTPMQYIGDSVAFVEAALGDLQGLVEAQHKGLVALGMADNTRVREQVEQAREEADLEYIEGNVGFAFERVTQGIQQVDRIIAGMKLLVPTANPEIRSESINQAICDTLVVARNEYKYVADVETELGKISSVECCLADINQVLLNLVMNAAQAISEVVGDSGDRGLITIKTRQENGEVIVTVKDTGAGVPEELQDRIFDPFEMTREVAAGTGHALSIARNIVVDKHGGSLTAQSKVGEGTTFVIKLPVERILS